MNVKEPLVACVSQGMKNFFVRKYASKDSVVKIKIGNFTPDSDEKKDENMKIIGLCFLSDALQYVLTHSLITLFFILSFKASNR